MKTIKQRILFLVILLFLSANLSAKKSPLEIKYTVMDLNALRYYPFKTPADSIVKKLIEETKITQSTSSGKKTTVDFIANREYIEEQVRYSVQANDIFYKYLIRPYASWLSYAAPLTTDTRDLVLTLGLHRDSLNKEERIVYEEDKGIYGFIGEKNVDYLIDQLLDDIDLFSATNYVMLLTIRSPLTKKDQVFTAISYLRHSS